MKAISRKVFLRSCLTLGASLFSYVFIKSIGIDKLIGSNRENIVVEINSLPEGCTFVSDFIIIKKSGDINVFSAECTHLGCKINISVDNLLMCPCHGSKFNFDGRVISGPASKALKTLTFSKGDNGKIIIKNI